MSFATVRALRESDVCDMVGMRREREEGGGKGRDGRRWREVSGGLPISAHFEPFCEGVGLVEARILI